MDNDGKEKRISLTVIFKDGTEQTFTKVVSNQIEGEYKTRNSGWGEEIYYTSNDIEVSYTYDANTKELSDGEESLITRETGFAAVVERLDYAVDNKDPDFSQGGWHVSGSGGNESWLPKGEGDVEYKEGLDVVLDAFGALSGLPEVGPGPPKIEVTNNKGATERIADAIVEATKKAHDIPAAIDQAKDELRDKDVHYCTACTKKYKENDEGNYVKTNESATDTVDTHVGL